MKKLRYFVKKNILCVTFIISIGPTVIIADEVFYSELDADITNPDRGFYYPYTTRSSNFVPLVESELIERRVTGYVGFQANYQVKSSIGLRHYVLDSFTNSDQLSPSFLGKVISDFNTARSAGVRLILRFSYTNTPNPGTCAANFICPPYGDVEKQRVIKHIQQLAPLLKDNEDVILGVQQGFIGTWGENYYSDHFGDPSVNANQGYLTNQNWLDRNEVVAELLQAIPVSRMLQLRYPQAKQRYLLGPTAPLNTSVMTREQAFNENDIARLGFHNDCLLASEDDLGTFADYGNDQSPVSSNNSLLLKRYAQDDGRYTLVGGETCSDDYSPQNNCGSEGGSAVETMRDYHYTFLNSDYNNSVNNDWMDGDCLEEIKKQLGYRLVLNKAVIPNSSSQGQAMPIELEVTNTGFAAPLNPRELWLIFRNEQTQLETKYRLRGEHTNPQQWLSGETRTVRASPTLSDLDVGDYSLLLHIADPSNDGRIIQHPEFSVRLANQDLWESTTGYNNLGISVKVLENVGSQEFDILNFIPAILSDHYQVGKK